MNRRAFLAAAGGALAAGCDLSLKEGVLNSCRAALPPALAADSLVRSAWRGIVPADVWDVHCHLFGNGDSGAGPWFNPAMESLLRPQQYVQRLFFMNAGCVHESPGHVDASVVDRIRNQCAMLPAGAKVVLLAFDWARDDARHAGARALDVLRARCVRRGGCRAGSVAIRMGGVRASECEGCARPPRLGRGPRRAGRQVAAVGAGHRPRIPAMRRVLLAAPRAAPAVDLACRRRAGGARPRRGARQPFASAPSARCRRARGRRALRLAGRGARPRPRELSPAGFQFLAVHAAHGDPGVSSAACTATSRRSRRAIASTCWRRSSSASDWHARLLNGSDYPLPGILPLISPDLLVTRGMLDPSAVPVLREIREHNALLFDFVLKRSLVSNGTRLASGVFETRSFFANPS